MSDTVIASAIDKPVSSLKPNRPCIWKPVHILEGVVNVQGGYNRTASSATSIQYKIGDIVHTFVQIDKKAVWFYKGVGGSGMHKSALREVRVLDDIRAKFDEWQPEPDPQAHAPDDDYDAMDALDALNDDGENDGTPTVKRRKVTRIKLDPKSKGRAEVRNIFMPTRPACIAGDSTSTKLIAVYRKAATTARVPTLWLRTDCLNWLLAYAADELHYQGVASTLDSAVADALLPRIGNCPEVDGLYLEWDFGAKEWIASFVAGPCDGKIRRFGASHLTNHRWSRLLSDGAVVGDRSTSTPTDKKSIAKAFITKWCASITRNESGAFESDWRLEEAILETPPKAKRPRRSGADDDAGAGGTEPTAVAECGCSDDDIGL
jgi:hypothetical protein